jgi:hypothetical protein
MDIAREVNVHAALDISDQTVVQKTFASIKSASKEPAKTVIAFAIRDGLVRIAPQRIFAMG